MTTYVLVHGAWLTGEIWADVAETLRASGHHAKVVDRLPSAGSRPEELGDLAADAAHLREILDDLDDVVLVAHSYGGFPATEVAGHLALRHTVYLAAFCPNAGESLSQIRSPHPEQWLDVRDDGSTAVTADLAIAQAVLAADLAPERFAQLHTGLQLQSTASLAAGSAGAAGRRHQTTYAVCLRDRALHTADQRRMAQSADRVVEIDAGHMAMISAPAAVSALLLELA
jgi:pimeloyl-ACP methyl ester carboxylesterase